MTLEESEALKEAVSRAMKPAEEPSMADMGRGKRRRPLQSLAELGERAFKQRIKEGDLSASAKPVGLRTVTFLGGSARDT
jgi:hypothetical protein